MRRKFLSVLLAMAMVLTTLPVTALAAEGDYTLHDSTDTVSSTNPIDLTYGQALSEIDLSAYRVQVEDAGGKKSDATLDASGALAWADDTETPNVADATADVTFTPDGKSQQTLAVDISVAAAKAEIKVGETKVYDKTTGVVSTPTITLAENATQITAAPTVTITGVGTETDTTVGTIAWSETDGGAAITDWTTPLNVDANNGLTLYWTFTAETVNGAKNYDDANVKGSVKFVQAAAETTYNVGGTVSQGTGVTASVSGIRVDLYAKADTGFDTSLGNATTASDGTYTIGTKVENGAYVAVVAASAGNYQRSTANVTVNGQAVTNADIMLVAEAPAEDQGITSVAVTGLTAPVVAEAPVAKGDLAASDTSKYEVTNLAWSPTIPNSLFLGDTAYTATVTLTAKTGYKFTADTAVPTNTATVTYAGKVNADGTYELKATFAKTAAATVSSIVAELADAEKTYTVGDTPAKADFKVTATYNDGTTKVLAATDDYTITDPAGTFDTAGDLVAVEITCNGKKASVNVTVLKAPITVEVANDLAVAAIDYGAAVSTATSFSGGDVTNADGGATISGTWGWAEDVDTTATLAAGKHNLTAVFTPTDATENITNSEDLTVTVELTVNKIAATGNVNVTILAGQYLSKAAPKVTDIVVPTTGTGKLSETVNGTFQWYSDSARANELTDTDLETASSGASTEIYWKFTPDEGNYTGEVVGAYTVNFTTDTIQRPAFAASTTTKTYGDAQFDLIATNKGLDGQEIVGGGAISYASSDASIASIDADTGKVTIHKAGTVTITATAAVDTGFVEGKGTCTLTINPLPITITPANVSAIVGDSAPALGSTYNTDYTTDPELVSGDATNLTVALGYATTPDMTKPGEVAINVTDVTGTAASNYTITRASGKLTISAAPVAVESVSLPATATVQMGSTLTLTLTFTPANATTGKDGSWTSSDTAVATVAGGVVTPVATGTTTIKFTSDGGYEATCVVTVTAASSSHKPSGGSSGGGGGTSSSVTVPVSGDDHSVNVSAKVSGNEATIEKIDGLDKVIDSGASTGVVEIDLTALNRNIDTVKLPTNDLEDIADAAADGDNDVDGLSVKLDSGTVEFDVDALAAIASQATTGSIELKLEKTTQNSLNSAQKNAVADMEVHGHFDLTLNGGKVITDFKGGQVTVRIPFTVPADKDSAGFVVVYVANDGTTEEMDTRCSGSYITFTTGHFSKYLIVYKDSEAVDEPADQPDSATCDGGANCPANKFTDVNTDLWYHNAIDFVLTNGLMSGVGDSTFAPNANLSRAMLAQILYNQEGKPAVTNTSVFDDVAAGMWYTNAIAWAAENGVVSGLGDGKFGPNNNITREQLAVMLFRYAGSPSAAGGGSLDRFADGSKASSYAQEALVWATGMGIMNGKGGGMLDPQGQATRAEVAQMLYNYLNI